MAATTSAGGPTNTSPASATARGEPRVLGEQAVAGVHGPRAVGRAPRRRRRRRRGTDGDAHRLVGDPRRQRARVDVGVDHDRAQSQLAARPHDAHGDLTAVGDEDRPGPACPWRPPRCGRLPNVRMVDYGRGRATSPGGTVPVEHAGGRAQRDGPDGALPTPRRLRHGHAPRGARPPAHRGRGAWAASRPSRATGRRDGCRCASGRGAGRPGQLVRDRRARRAGDPAGEAGARRRRGHRVRHARRTAGRRHRHRRHRGRGHHRAHQHRKQGRLIEHAQRGGFPLVLLCDADGGRMPDVMGWRTPGSRSTSPPSSARPTGAPRCRGGGGPRPVVRRLRAARRDRPLRRDDPRLVGGAVRAVRWSSPRSASASPTTSSAGRRRRRPRATPTSWSTPRPTPSTR